MSGYMQTSKSPSPYCLPCPRDLVKNMTIGPSLVTQSFFVRFLLFHTEEKRIKWKTFLYCGDSQKRISRRYHSRGILKMFPAVGKIFGQVTCFVTA